MTQGVETSFIAVLEAMLCTFAKSLPLYWGIFGVFFLISILIQKGVVAMGVSVATSILLVVFSNKLYESTANILRYSPIIQINKLDQSDTGEYLVSVTISLVILAFCLGSSIIKFNHDEL